MSIVTTQALKEPLVRKTHAHAAFAGLIVLSVLVFWKTFHALAVFSVNHESSSHILLIPLISIYLLYTERSQIFRVTRTSPVAGGAVVLAAITLYVFVLSHLSLRAPEQFLPGATLAIVSLWLGGFLWCYGGAAWRRASFSLLFLLLMVPLPQAILERTIYLLQQGSTEIAYLLFKAVGVPVLRQGFILAVPSVTIEVAKECSGIRSSVALFITCLLAAHLFLRTKWRMLVFVLLAFPLAIIKNGIRITTLTLLSVYVDPGFLSGDLHRKGGFVFFILALAILFPVLLLLQRLERSPAKPSGIAHQKIDRRLVGES
jgi:exosortase